MNDNSSLEIISLTKLEDMKKRICLIWKTGYLKYHILLT